MMFKTIKVKNKTRESIRLFDWKVEFCQQLFVFFCPNRDSQLMQSAYARSVLTPVNIPNMDLIQKATEQRLHCKCASRA